MSEWASKLMNAVLPDRTKGDFEQYLTEVSNDQAERMYFQKDIDIEYECRPTYEQLSIERIIDEANRNMNALKMLENLIMERLAGFSSFSGNITKYRTFADSFENSEGSLRISIDAFCLFIDQVSLYYQLHFWNISYHVLAIGSTTIQTTNISWRFETITHRNAW